MALKKWLDDLILHQLGSRLDCAATIACSDLILFGKPMTRQKQARSRFNPRTSVHGS